MGRTVRTGVVGLGYFGAFHAKQYAANPGASLTMVCDADPRRAAAVAALYGAAAVTDHRDLIGAIEAVSVAVPTAFHHAVARDFIEAGIHVLIEKPVTDDPVTARDLAEQAERRRVVLQVGHIERFSATFEAMQRVVGAPILIDCLRAGPWTGRAADVDVVLDLMIHDIDLALALAGAPVETIDAAGSPVVSPFADAAEARLTFRNGVVATLRASRVAPEVERKIRVVEENRVLVADLVGRTLAIGSRGVGADGKAAFPFETAAVPQRDALGQEIEAFLDSIRTGSPVAVDGRAALDALTIAHRIRAKIDAAHTRPTVAALQGELSSWR